MTNFLRFSKNGLFLLMLVMGITNLFAQGSRTITGTVTNAEGLPVLGANVIIKGTTTGVTSDFDGNYSINANADDVLVFSYVGFRDQEVPVGTQTLIDVQLAEDVAALDEVVVVGYGTQKKGDITSSVAHVDSEDFVKAPVKDIGQLLTGKVAGLTITNSSGNPNDPPSIFLRGTSSISNATPPLVLIDGIPGSLSDFAPEDVASIDILKDGSAAAIYGTRANNGVILVTTKQGNFNAGKPQLTLETSVSTQSILNKPDFLTAAQYRQAIADGIIPEISDQGASTDWIDEITRNNVSKTYDLSIRGGSDKTSYYGAINYRDLQGVFLGSNNKNLFANINVEQRMFNDKLRISLGINNRDNTTNLGTVTGSFDNFLFRNAEIANPTAPLYKPEGADYAGDYYQSFAVFVNPVANIKNSDGELRTHRTRVKARLEFQPIDPLTFTLNMAQVSSNTTRGYYENKFHFSNLSGGLNGYANKGSNEYKDRQLDFTTQFEKRFNEHHITALAGYSYFETEYEESAQYAYNFATDFFSYNNMGSATNLGPTGELSYLNGSPFTTSYKQSYNLIAGFGRLNYDYDGKYLVSGTIRYEGSSKFIGSNHPWGTFWAASAGWRMEKEDFIKDIDWVSQLKLRVGYGVTGSAPNGYYLGLAQLGLSSVNNSFYYNGNFVQTLAPFQNPNTDLTWEEKKETNIGIDFGLFNNRLNGSIDLYKRRTDGLLFNFPVPQPPNLVGSTFANAGVMDNNGIEVGLNYDVLRGSDFNWSTQITGSYNKNKFVSFSDNPKYSSSNNFADFGSTGPPIQQSTHRLQEGQPVGNFFGFKVTGITDDGKWVYDDLNDDGKITNDDRQILGNGIPKYHLAFNNTFRYKNFDLAVTMRGAFDYQILNFNRMYYENNSNQIRNRLASALKPVFGKAVLTEPEAYNSYYIENGDYWKIDNIVLGYNFEPKQIDFIDSIRIYASTLNTFVFTNYKGVDPEISPEGVSPGNDNRDKYPTTRTYTFGLNIKF